MFIGVDAMFPPKEQLFDEDTEKGRAVPAIFGVSLRIGNIKCTLRIGAKVN
jgi:hypothetical protein